MTHFIHIEVDDRFIFGTAEVIGGQVTVTCRGLQKSTYYGDRPAFDVATDLLRDLHQHAQGKPPPSVLTGVWG